MTDTAAAIPTTPAAPRAETPPPVTSTGVIGWVRGNLVDSWTSAVLTIAILWALFQVVPPLFTWLFIDAHGFDAPSSACRVDRGGACWAFVGEKARFILFGTFPVDQQWRPLTAVLIFVALIGASCQPRCWRPWLGAVWLGGLIAVGVLMWGGILGLPFVENALWGGLPLTIMLSVVGLALAFPLAVALALGRRSELPGIKALCVGFIELIRGVPLISLLFMSSVMFPLFLPEGFTVDKLLRAQVAFILFAAAYQAEAIRGGLQATPKGQYEAADALGLSYRRKMGLVVLPQALTISIPPLVNTFIAFFKDTSLVIIIGLYDLLGTAKAALTDPEWRGFYLEAYLFVAAIYWCFCFFMSKYSQWLEKSLHRGHRR